MSDLKSVGIKCEKLKMGFALYSITLEVFVVILAVVFLFTHLIPGMATTQDRARRRIDS